MLDPTAETARSADGNAPPGSTRWRARPIGLLDISKARGDVFLDRIEELLENAASEVMRFRKPTFTKPAPVDLRHEIATQCDAVIEALAD